MKVFLIILFAVQIISCENNKTSKNKSKRENFDEGYHKAYVEILNTNTDDVKYVAAEVYIKDALVVKICFQDGKCLDNFDFWDDSYIYYQQVFSKGNDPRVYSVYIIPKGDEQFDDDYDENENN